MIMSLRLIDLGVSSKIAYEELCGLDQYEFHGFERMNGEVLKG